MSEPRLVFEGNKFFWRTRNNVDVWILEHKELEIFEVVCYEPSLDMESERFYLQGSVLLRKIDNAAIDNKLSFAMRNNVPLTDTYVEGARNEVIRDYVLSRLLLDTFNAQDKQFSMKWNTLVGDVEFGEADELLVRKPEPLKQYQAKHNKIYMHDVVSAVLESLQELKEEIKTSCDAAQEAQKVVRSSLGVRDRWRMPLVMNKVLRGMNLNRRDKRIFEKVQSNLNTPEKVSQMEATFQKPTAPAAVLSATATPRTATQGDTTPSRSPRRSIGGTTTPPLNLTPRRANSSMRRSSGSGIAGNLRGETASSLARAANSEFTPPPSTKGKSTKHPLSPTRQPSTKRTKGKSIRSSGASSAKDGVASASSGASMSFSCDEPYEGPVLEPSILEAMSASIKALSNSIRSSFSTKREPVIYTVAVSPRSGSQKSSASEGLLDSVPEATQTGTETQMQSQTVSQGATAADEVEDSLALAMAGANASTKVKPSTRRSFLSSMLQAITGAVELVSWGGSVKVTPV